MNAKTAILAAFVCAFSVAGAEATGIVLTASPAPPTPANLGQTVTLTATVTPGTSTGLVTFLNGGEEIGSASLVSGVATLSTILLPPSTSVVAGLTLTARYQGASNSISYFVASVAGTGFGFKPESPITPGSGAQSVQADFNNDGKMDLAYIDPSAGKIVILLGRGDGTFSFQSSITAPATYIAAADLNGDGIVDLAVAFSNTVTVFKGNGSAGAGNGTFTIQSTQPLGNAGGALSSLHAGDFNEDGFPDLITSSVDVVNFGAGILVGQTQVWVLQGDGNFGFLAIDASPAALGELLPSGMVLGDFDGDGHTDVVLSVVIGNTGERVLIWMKGKGDGTFTFPGNAQIFGPLTTNFFVGGDFNGDGFMDLAVADSAGNIRLLLNNGTATFTAAAGNPFFVGSGIGYLATGDFNGDRNLDLIATTTNGMAYILGNGLGSFSAPLAAPVGAVSAPSTCQSPNFPLVADYNGDQRDDFVVTCMEGTQPYAVGLGLSPTTTTLTAAPKSGALLGQAITLTAAVTPTTATGKVTFYNGTSILGTAPLSVSTSTAILATVLLPPSSAALGLPLSARYEGDSSNGVSVGAFLEPLSTLPSKGFTPGTPVSLGNQKVIAQSDFDGDGIRDLVVSDGIGRTVILLGNGTGGFTAQAPPLSAGATSLAVGDLDGDGNPDLVLLNNQSIVVYLNCEPVACSAGTVTFTQKGSPIQLHSSTNTSTVRIADFNSDGIPDLVVTGSSSGVGQVNVFLGNGDGTFQAAVTSVVCTAGNNIGSNPVATVVGDFDGDGIPDLLVLATASGGGRDLFFLSGRGDGTFVPPATSILAPGPPSPAFLVSGDFDGNGFVDVAYLDAKNDVHVVLSNGTGVFTSPGGSTLGSNVTGLATGDFNGDGKLDLAATTSGNSVAILIGAGAGTFTASTPVSVCSGPNALVVGDYNADSHSDFAVVCTSNVEAYLGQSFAISSLVPASAVAGAGVSKAFSFTINSTNSNFAMGDVVNWLSPGQTVAQTLIPSSISPGSLTVTIGPSSTLLTTTGTATITVTDPNVSVPSNTLSFTIGSAPVISSVSPLTAAVAGTSAPITITGTSFASGDTVTFQPPGGGTAITGIVTTFNAMLGTLTATLPQSALVAPGAGSVFVVDGGSGVSSAAGSSFTIIPAPALININPTSIGAGSQPFPLTINGTGFVTGDTVDWTPAGAAVQPITGSAVSVTGSSQITVTVPASLLGAAGTASIAVVDPDGATSNTLANAFTIAAPSITALNPASIGTGSAGFTLAVNGSNFIAGTLVGGVYDGSVVLFTDSTGTLHTLVPTSSTGVQLQVSVPGAFIGGNISNLAQVVVQNPGPGSGFSGGAVSTATPLPIGAPTITTVVPTAETTVPAGSPSPSLTVNGSNFVATSVLSWCDLCNGSPTVLTPTTTPTPTQLIVSIPTTSPNLLAAVGTAQISVANNPANLTSLSTNSPTASLQIASLVISSISPTTALAGGPAFTLTITGQNQNFDGKAQVLFGNGLAAIAPATVTGNSITVIVPPSYFAAPGSLSIQVQNPSGAISPAVSLPIQQLSISNVNPTPLVAGSTALTLDIQGQSFTSSTTILWTSGVTSTPLTPTFNSSTDLSAVITQALLAQAGTVQVTAVTPVQGVNISSAPFPVTINGPVIGNLAPSSSVVNGGAFPLQVTGSNFLNGSSIHWTDGTGATTSLITSFVSPTQLTALVQTSLLTSAGTALVTVVNPAPSGGTGATSSGALFAIGPTPTINTNNGLSVCPGGVNCSPSTSATAASASFLLKVNGINYQPGSIVVWTANGAANNLITGFIDSTDLQATVPASLLANVSTALITVQNPGNAISNGIIFNVNAGATPTVTSLMPANGVTIGSTAFQLTVIGTNFASGAQVNWTNSGTTTGLSTVSQDPQTLNAVVPANLVAAVGNAFITVVSAGAASNSVAFPINPVPAVTITSLGQQSATAGGSAFTLAVTGTNFNSASVVQWSSGAGPQALATIFGGPTQLSALVPATMIAAAGTAFVNVANSGGVLSNSVTFSIGAASGPSVGANGVSPSSATAGAAAFLLTVTGQNFVSGSQVEWNSGLSPQALPTVFVDASHLTVVVPASLVATAGTAFISVQNPGGLSSGLTTFPIGSAAGPTILSPNGLAPSGAVAGGAGFQLSVAGSNFTSGAIVQWAAGGSPVALTTAFVSASQLTALVPAALIAATGSAFVSVQNPNSTVSNLVGFSITAVPGPAISATGGLNPAVALTGASGLTMTVAGANFSSGSVVDWNSGGTPQPLTTGFISSSVLTALVPATLLAAPASALVTVVNPDKSVSNSALFTVTGPAPLGAPTLASVSPASAAAGSGSFQLSVLGTNFAAAVGTTTGSVVQWDGSPLPTTFVSSTQLTAQVDMSLLQAPGTNFVAVLNGNSSSAGVKFQVSGPAATSMLPATVTAGAAAFSLVVSGTNFVNGSTVVWSGTNVPTTFNSATQVTAQIGANLVATAGTAFVLVSSPGGGTTSPLIFTISVPPSATVSGLNPASAVAGSSAFQLFVTGSGFVSGSIVMWNGSPLATGFVGSTQLTALVDSSLVALPGTGNVTVQNPGSPLSTPVKFPVNGPTIATLTPATANAGDPAFTLTVAGTNFVPGTAVQWNGTALPTAYSSSTQLQAAVPASLVASPSTVSVTVQNPGGAGSPSQAFTVGQPALTITSASLPDGIVGTFYSRTLSAQGGNQPYNWTVTAGNLPAGLNLDAPSGTVSGTPTGAASVVLSVTVTDSQGRTAVKSLQLNIALALTITTLANLPPATSGTAYSVVLAAAGGSAPYLWSVVGTLPPGLSLNVATGEISGLPVAPGGYHFTINVTDSRQQQTASTAFTATVTVSSLTIGGLVSAAAPAQQIPVTVNISAPYGVDLTGSLTLSFTSAVGGGDPSIQFSTGGSTVSYTIPAGSTTAVFPQNAQLLVSTGTVAGTIAIKASLQAGASDITPAPAPTAMTAVPKQAPVITSVKLKQATGGGGVTVTIAGYSTTKELTQAAIQFNAAAGSSLTAPAITVPLSAVIATWYQSAAAAAFGSQFTVTIPVNVSGDVTAIGSVTVTLTNTMGNSAAATSPLQ